ncbi:hypothetical protein GobsT_48770 [Gemmata obscuriglobus]|uniref:Uncharacterized protein n=1 Tax=Gemmata obscuriglobus TaxID=114 RepID=A0A2Z3H0T4_9BACT|nr:hypothetical protein [Gemmata obscuriglobus]AWM37186.1 hypothetical protein C1280_09225 [Gemmata obscuriglobus]QEG30077.1 hypothetical protein GobsT_48770 [Gemmata obscuriglobus]VTS09398.1 unnamed protein product [Gemmata obscuriglobus UQM 2246]
MPPEQPPINLIRVFDFYVTLMFVISLVRRWDVYLNAVRILIGVQGRWPKLIARLSEHSSLILNWSFFRPALLALVLTLVQLLFSRLIFPLAVLTGPQLQREWWWVPVVLVPLLPMLAVDIYFVVRVSKFDHDETVKYLDQAETWLGWKGPLVRAVTLGFVDPYKMVDEEVKKSLEGYRTTLNASLWWVAVQIGLRLLFGLTLWIVWAIHSY